MFPLPNEINAFIEKYNKRRILIRTPVDSVEEQKQLGNKYSII